MSTPEQTPAANPPAEPQGTPPAESPRDDRQSEIDRIVAERVAREKRKHADETKELKTKAAEADRLRKERETETEKAIREAREQARAEALRETAPRLVLAEMRAAAAGRVGDERFDVLTEDLDLSKFLTDDGEVDLVRVRRKVDAMVPAAAKQGEQQDEQPQPPAGPRRPRPDPTQGTGRPPAGDGDRGIAEARKRFGARAVGPAATS